MKRNAELRKKTMQAIKSNNTLLERTVTAALWEKGFRFRKNVKDLHGKPDIAIKKYKVVIFLDSCFWHACPDHCRLPNSNTDYWLPKIKRNKERDAEINNYYEGLGWNILRVWEHDIKENFDQAIHEIASFINKAKNNKR